MNITDHAFARAKKRLGWNAAALKRMVDKALNQGITHAQTSGRLKRYLDKLYLSHENGTKLRLYGEHVFIFSDSALITVLHLPNRMRRAARDSAD